MPGRQSTGPPLLRKPKPKKSKAKRALNALAIAEKVTPERKQKKAYRLGDSEETPIIKRKRGDDEELLDEGAPKRSRRNLDDEDENVELESDSSGNEWMTGKVDDEDDSELDSDEAFGESDDDRFEGYIFRGGSSGKQGSSSSKSKITPKERRTQAAHLEEKNENDAYGGEGSEEEDDFGQDGVELADILDAEGQDEDGLGDEESNFEESEEDDADSEDQSALSMSDEDEGDSASKLDSLHKMVNSMQNGAASRQQDQIKNLGSMPPSEFGVPPRRKLTLADIMPTITDPAMRRSVKHLMADDTSSKKGRKEVSRKLDAPLPKRQQDRIDRKAAYDKSKETLDRWVDTVKQNRRAEHLQFPLKDPDAPAPQGQNRLLPLDQSKPISSLESTIQKIMEDSGMIGADGKLNESQIQAAEELKTNKMPIQEVLARRAELRRQRDLLFREEIRAKRIKKIKSKNFRKIHRKERERNTAQIKSALRTEGDADSESEKERNDRRRAEERMGAKHRESKWAKGMKASGRTKWDDDARDGVMEMARKDEELRRRMEGRRVKVDDESDSYEDESEDEGDDDNSSAVARSNLPSRIQGSLNGEDDNNDQPRSKLSEMNFMKKAQVNQKDQNDAEIRQLERDMNGENANSESDASEGIGRKVFGPQKSAPISLPETGVQRSEFEEPEHSDGEARTEPRLRAGVDIDRVTIDTGGNMTASAPVQSDRQFAQIQTTQGPWNAQQKQSGKSSRDQVSAAGEPKPSRSALKDAQPAEKAGTTDKSTKKSSRPSDLSTKNHSKAVDEDSESEDEPVVMTNADLARRAFAGDDVLDEQFQQEKAELAKEQDDQIIDETLPGWGSWTGLGVSKKASKPRARHREIKKVDGVAPADRKDAKLKDVIISEKKIKKNGKYLASQLPHPFETRAQYERSLRLPVGPEWTTKETYQGMTKPRILMKPGIIAPMSKPLA